MNLGKEIGMIFGGGGFSGVYGLRHAEELAQKGIIPDYVQGESIGALNALLLTAAEWDIKKGKEKWITMQKLGASEIFPKSGMIKNACLRKTALSDFKPILKYILNDIDFRAVIDSRRKLQIITVNESTGKQQIFSNRDKKIKDNPGNLKDIALSSIAIYGFLPPTLIDKEWYADAMIFNLSEAIKAGCDTIFVSLNYQLPLSFINSPQSNFGQRIQMGYRIMGKLLSAKEIELAALKGGYEIIENNPSGLFENYKKSLSSKIKTPIINTLKKITLSRFPKNKPVPRRLVVLTPSNPINTLETVDFRQPNIKIGYPGDIITALNQINLTDEFWQKLE